MFQRFELKAYKKFKLQRFILAAIVWEKRFMRKFEINSEARS